MNAQWLCNLLLEHRSRCIVSVLQTKPTTDCCCLFMIADLSNAVSLGREFRRRKRGSVRRRGGESPSSSSAAAMASCVSKIGDTVESVRRTQEDAAALAFKLAKIHARDAKMLRANASSIRNHVDALHSEVQVPKPLALCSNHHGPRRFYVHTLVENMAKKNHSCFPIAVLLTTLICNH